MNGIGVHVGVCPLMGGWVWHFTSLSITPTITSWHFCISLIFRPLSLGLGECVCVCVSMHVCVQSGQLILLFTTTANIYSVISIPAFDREWALGLPVYLCGPRLQIPQTQLSQDLTEFPTLSPCSRLNRGWNLIFRGVLFGVWGEGMLKRWKESHNGSLNQRQPEQHWYFLTLRGYKEEDAACACVCVCVWVYACSSWSFFCIAQLQKQSLHFNLLLSCTADPRKDRRERPRLSATPIAPSLPRNVSSSHSAVLPRFFLYNTLMHTSSSSLSIHTYLLAL